MNDIYKRLKLGTGEDIPKLLEESFYLIFGKENKDWIKLSSGSEQKILADQRDLWRDREFQFKSFLNVKAWTSAAEILLPDHLRIVAITEEIDRSGWFVKMCVHNPHKTLPTVQAKEKSLALVLACVKYFKEEIQKL